MYFLTAEGCVLAAIASGIICAAANPLAKFAGLIDKPDGVRKLHKGGVPLVGGLAIILPASILACGYLLFVQAERTLGIAVASLLAASLVGVMDDRAGLPVVKRLASLAAIVALACLFEPSFVLHNL